jgi:hypothetical protein
LLCGSTNYAQFVDMLVLENGQFVLDVDIPLTGENQDSEQIIDVPE